MTLDEVQTKLTQLNISDRYRFVYPATATRPGVLLVRTYGPGDPWPQAGKGVRMSFHPCWAGKGVRMSFHPC